MVSLTRQDIMGMPITVNIVDKHASQKDVLSVFNYFQEIDARFSTYKNDSEIAKINRGEITKIKASSQMRKVFTLAQKTKLQTNGYFNILRQDNSIDPSGIVKGWAIWQASIMLKKSFNNFYIEAGGDIQVSGYNAKGRQWTVGIKNPFKQNQIIKIVGLFNKGIATSGSYIRGQHIYNPWYPDKKLTNIVSLTVIGPNVYEADRFATAAFAMQEKGIKFIENLDDFEGYMIDKKGIATMTSGFQQYQIANIK